jgi:hypothetical protein
MSPLGIPRRGRMKSQKYSCKSGHQKQKFHSHGTLSKHNQLTVTHGGVGEVRLAVTHAGELLGRVGPIVQRPAVSRALHIHIGHI